jgi:hypothetical protein
MSSTATTPPLNVFLTASSTISATAWIYTGPVGGTQWH